MRRNADTSAREALGGGCDCSRSRLPACVRALRNGRYRVRHRPTSPVIDTAAPVDPQQCAPCHLDLSTVNQPGLVFNHGSHLMVSCDGCHSRMPHQNGHHRVGADGGLLRLPRRPARSAGRARRFGVPQVPHASRFDLVPRRSPADQAVRRQAARRAGQEDRHQRLHDVSHGEQGLQPLPRREGRQDRSAARRLRLRRFARAPKGPSIKIYPDGPTNMAQCVYCHPDLDSIIPGRLIFAHAQHLQRAYPCEACHPKFGHSAAGRRGAGHDVVLSLPRTAASGPGSHRHRGLRRLPSQGLRPGSGQPHQEVHRRASTRCAPARIRRTARCATRPSSASTATRQEPDGQAGRSRQTTRRATGRSSTASSIWRRRATAGPATPPSRARGATRPACRTRRGGFRTTSPSLASAPRTATSATGSRDVSELPPPRRQERRAHRGQLRQVPPADAPAAAHVDSQQGVRRACGALQRGEDKGPSVPLLRVPHLTSVRRRRRRQVELQQGHDLRLCYQCHGAVDALNREIAPYKGAELCLKCHTQLGI